MEKNRTITDLHQGIAAGDKKITSRGIIFAGGRAVAQLRNYRDRPRVKHFSTRFVNSRISQSCFEL